MSKAIQTCITKVEETRKDVIALLKETEFHHSILNIDSLFKQILTRFKFQGGILNEEIKKETSEKLQPLKRFMGADINVAQKKMPVMTRKAESDVVSKLRDRVEKLWDILPTQDAVTVIKSHPLPEDQLVIRGVAKKAGIKGFKTADLTKDFIEELKLAVDLKNEEAKKQKEIDEKLKNGKAKE